MESVVESDLTLHKPNLGDCPGSALADVAVTEGFDDIALWRVVGWSDLFNVELTYHIH